MIDLSKQDYASFHKDPSFFMPQLEQVLKTLETSYGVANLSLIELIHLRQIVRECRSEMYHDRTHDVKRAWTVNEEAPARWLWQCYGINVRDCADRIIVYHMPNNPFKVEKAFTGWAGERDQARDVVERLRQETMKKLKGLKYREEVKFEQGREAHKYESQVDEKYWKTEAQIVLKDYLSPHFLQHIQNLRENAHSMRF